MPNNPSISLTDNSHNEGTYRMLSPGTRNQYVFVPYSDVALAQRGGYNFDDGNELERYQKDFVAARNPYNLQRVKQMVKDMAIGAGKGALSDVESIDRLGRDHLPAFFTNDKFGFGKPVDLDKLHEMTKTNDNIAQEAGKDWEQSQKDFAIGAGKGALTSASSGDRWARKHLPAFLTNNWFGFGHPADLDKLDEMKTAHNSAQRIGKGTEQAAEFLIPVEGEEAVGAKLADYLPRFKSAAPVATAALSTGLVNKNQGNSFWEGAALGGVARGIANAASAFAPTLAQKAMGLGSEADASGNVLLDETTGVHPYKIAAQARERMHQYLGDLLARAKNSKTLVDLAPARAEADSMLRQAIPGNNDATIKDLIELQKQLSEWKTTGKAIPQYLTPEDALQLKDGLDGLFHNWQGGDAEAVKEALSTELSDAIPDYKAAADRIDDLRKVAKSREGIKPPQNFKRRVLDSIPGFADSVPLNQAAAEKAASKMLPFPEAQLAIARGLYSDALPTVAKASAAAYEASRGPQRWMELGAKNLAVSGIDDVTIARLRTTREGQQLLKDAGDASVGSRRLAAIVSGLLQQDKRRE